MDHRPDISNSPKRPEDRILDAATTIVAYNGVAGANLRTVAEAARTSLSQVYAHHETRDQLLVKVFQRGWTQIERAIVRRAVGIQSPRQLAMAIFEALLDAYEADRITFSATIILGTEPFGDPTREALKQSDGFSGYRSIGSALMDRVRTTVPADELPDVIEFLFGAVERRLLLLSPLCVERAGKTLDFDRARLVRVFGRMLDGLLSEQPQVE